MTDDLPDSDRKKFLHTRDFAIDPATVVYIDKSTIVFANGVVLRDQLFEGEGFLGVLAALLSRLETSTAETSDATGTTPATAPAAS